jgi:hypothetical protein
VPPHNLEQERDGVAIVETTRSITGGVDTHLDTHVVAALDPKGGVLGVAAFPATGSPSAIRLTGTTPTTSPSTSSRPRWRGVAPSEEPTRWSGQRGRRRRGRLAAADDHR